MDNLIVLFYLTNTSHPIIRQIVLLSEMSTIIWLYSYWEETYIFVQMINSFNNFLYQIFFDFHRISFQVIISLNIALVLLINFLVSIIKIIHFRFNFIKEFFNLFLFYLFLFDFYCKIIHLLFQFFPSFLHNIIDELLILFYQFILN